MKRWIKQRQSTGFKSIAICPIFLILGDWRSFNHENFRIVLSSFSSFRRHKSPSLQILPVYVLLFFMLAGCTVGPVYKTPEVETPCEWHGGRSKGMNSDSPDSFLWWERLGDPVLNSLIQRTAAANLDLRIAATRILEARAIGKGKSAQLYPHIDGSICSGQVYNKESLLQGILKNATPQGHGKSNTLNTSFFEIGFDADWEIDLFGMTDHEIKAQKAESEASQENFGYIWVTLSAETARNYIELRGFQQKLTLVNLKIESLRNSLQLTKNLWEEGFVSLIELRRAEEELSTFSTQRPPIELAIDKSIHRLSVLLGSVPGTLFEELGDLGPLPCLPDQTPVGLPSELLRRRPDIRRAERELAAATEKVGSAVAALFPRLSLRAFVGDIGTWLPSLFHSGSNTWFASPQLLLPIFNSRMLLQDVDYNEIKTRSALYEYQKTVLNAFEEAENAIGSFQSDQERNQHLARSKNSIGEAYSLTLNLYENGMKNYLEVLLVNQSRLSAEEAYLQSQVELLLQYISLYKALGGGWDQDICTEPSCRAEYF
jgi:multidrug efflux system outer membrane protein